MPGTLTHSCPKPLAALLALAALAVLGGGCAPRQPIPADQPRIADTAPAEVPAAPAKPAKAAKPAAAKAKPAPAVKEEAKAQPAPTPAVKEEAQAQPAPQAEQKAPAVAERPAYVQVGAFGTAMNALGAVSWLKNKGFESSRMVRVEQGEGVLFKVQAGPFQDLASAHKALEALKPDWPQAFIPQD